MTNIIGKKSFFWSKIYLKELLLALLLFFSPFFIFFHLWFDSDSHTLNIFGILINHGFDGNSDFVWMILGNVIPITLLLTWFFTSHYKWRYLILLPMSIFLRSLIFIMPDFVLNKPDMNVRISTISGMLIIIIIDFIFSKKNRKRIILENTFEYYINLKSKKFYNSLVDKLYGIQDEKKDLDFSHYLKNIYHLKTLLSNRQMKYGFSKFSSFKLKNKNIQWYISFMLIGVYLFYRLNYLMEKELMELDLGFIIFGKNGFFSFWAFFWYFSRKLAILLPLCIWFSISRNWWKYAILSPIFLYTYQVWEIFQGLDSLEGWENLRALPILLVVLLALIFISRTIRYESKIMDVQEQIVDEIEDLLQKQEDENKVQKDKFALERLRVEVASNEAKQQQLDALLSLKQKLENQLMEK